MKDLYTIEELSAIVNRLVRRTPTSGAVAIVPDLITTTVVPGKVTTVVMPAGNVDHFHTWLEMLPEDQRVDKKAKSAKMTFWSGDFSHSFDIKEGLDMGKGVLTLEPGPLYITVEEGNAKEVSVTLHYIPVVSDRILKSVVLIDPDEVLP